MIASELAKLGACQHDASIDAPSQAEAADMMQVSRASVQRARQVQANAPDIAVTCPTFACTHPERFPPPVG